MSKKNIFVISLIFVFTVISWMFLRDVFGKTLTYIINPLFWIALAIWCHFYLFNNINYVFKYKKTAIQIMLIVSLVYIILYFVLGYLISGFANNPYNTDAIGIMYNVFSLGLVIVFQEYVRSSLINKSKKKNYTVSMLLIVLAFIIIDINFISLRIQLKDLSSLIELVGVVFIPLVIQNFLFTYVSKHAGPLPGIIFKLITSIILWVTPILPDHPWIIISLLSSLIPFLGFLAIDYNINKRNNTISRRVLIETHPKKWIATFLIIVTVLFFMLGITPYYPVSIVSPSMYPVIEVGDVVIIKKSKIKDIEVGDIIQYKKETHTIVHRIVEIDMGEGGFFAIAKGDNNKNIDSTYITDLNISGKVILIVPKIGLPSVWLRRILKQVNDDLASED